MGLGPNQQPPAVAFDCFQYSLCGLVCRGAEQLLEVGCQRAGVLPHELGHALVHSRGAGDVCLDAPGVYAGGGNIATFHVEFLAQGLGEAANRELGRVIGTHAGLGEEPEDTGDVDHMAAARCLLQVRQEGLGPVEHALEIDVDDPVVVGVAGIGDRAGMSYAGVIEDQVDLAVVSGDVGCPFLDFAAFGHVYGGAGDRHTLAFAQAHCLGQAFGVHVTEGKVTTLGRQCRGQGTANAGPCAGYGGHLSGKGLHAGCSSSSVVAVGADALVVSPPGCSPALPAW